MNFKRSPLGDVLDVREEQTNYLLLLPLRPSRRSGTSLNFSQYLLSPFGDVLEFSLARASLIFLSALRDVIEFSLAPHGHFFLTS